jgi:AcrR family transcriptional regulator
MKEMVVRSADILGGPEMDGSKRRGNRTTRIPEILDAAIKVLASLGNAGFNQRRVASDIGIHLATLQHYFATREDLLRATIEVVAKRYLELYLAIADDPHRSPEARLAAIVDIAYDELTRPDSCVAAFSIESWSMAEREAFADELMANVNFQFQEMFSALVAKINPALTQRECALRGSLLYSHLLGLMAFVRPGRRHAPDYELFRAATKVVWRALSTGPE